MNYFEIGLYVVTGLLIFFMLLLYSVENKKRKKFIKEYEFGLKESNCKLIGKPGGNCSCIGPKSCCYTPAEIQKIEEEHKN